MTPNGTVRCRKEKLFGVNMHLNAIFVYDFVCFCNCSLHFQALYFKCSPAKCIGLIMCVYIHQIRPNQTAVSMNRVVGVTPLGSSSAESAGMYLPLCR